MRNIVSFGLILSLLAVLPVSAQDWLASPATGAIARSLAAEAAKLAASQSNVDSAVVAWSQVQELDRGVQLAVLEKDGTTIRGPFGEADDASLTLREGAYTNQITRAEVAEIMAIRPGKGSASAAAGFAMAGGLAAFLIDIGLAFSPCHGSCAGNVALMVGATVGLSLAGGFGGYYGFRKPARQLIYRAPSTT